MPTEGKARPKVWRDISNYVELQWVVCVNVPPVPPDERLVASEDPDIGGSVLENSRERPVILTLADCKSMAQSVSWIWKAVVESCGDNEEDDLVKRVVFEDEVSGYTCMYERDIVCMAQSD